MPEGDLRGLLYQVKRKVLRGDFNPVLVVPAGNGRGRGGGCAVGLGGLGALFFVLCLAVAASGWLVVPKDTVEGCEACCGYEEREHR